MGLVQVVQAPPSMLHSKVEPGSSDEKSKVAFGELRRVGLRRVDRRLRLGRVEVEGARGGASPRCRLRRARARARCSRRRPGSRTRRSAYSQSPRGDGRVVPDLGGAREAGAVPVVAGALADGDLDLGDAGAGAVGVGAAEAARGTAGVPLGRGVVAGGGGEGRVVELGATVSITQVKEAEVESVLSACVGGAHVEGVAAVGQAGVVLRARARAPGAAVAAALEGGAGLARRRSRSSGRSRWSGRRARSRSSSGAQSCRT